MTRLRFAAALVVAAAIGLAGCAEQGAGGKSITQTRKQAMTQVKREGDKVWIEGVKGWHMGERGSSIHAGQAAIMQAMGEDVTYTDLVGASGLAFRMQVHKEL